MGYCSTLQYFPVGCRGERPTTKTVTLTIRIDPGVKEALCTAAQQEFRSIANMVVVLIRKYCRRNCIPIEHATLKAEAEKK